MSTPERTGLLSLPGWEDVDQHGLADWLMEHGHFENPDAGGGLNVSLASAALKARALGLTDEGALTEVLTHLSVSHGRDPVTAEKEAHRAAVRSGTDFTGQVNGSARRPKLSREEILANARAFVKAAPESAKRWSSPVEIPESGADQLALVLNTFYEPTDHINLSTSDIYHGRTTTVKELLTEIAINGMPPSGERGAFWRANPVAPQPSGAYGTATDADVRRHEWVLLESDCIPLEWQVPLILAAGIRPAHITRSGGKSMQAAVRVQAADTAEYTAISTALLHGLAHLGADPVTTNPSRLRRLPGAVRPNGTDGPTTVQSLVYLDPDAPAYTLQDVERIATAVKLVTPAPLIWTDEIKVDITAPPTDIVEGLINRNSLIVTYGDSNVGKSFFKLDLCAHLATGKVWRPGCGDHITEPTPILYIALEGAVGLTHRIHVLKERGILAPGAPFAIMHTPINLQDDASALDVLRRVEEFRKKVGLPPGFIVVDTLSRAFGPGSENDAKDMTTAVRNLDTVKARCPAAVDVVHHCGKDQARGARGHSALRAATDTEIELFREEGSPVITAVVRKQRDLEPCAPMPFELESVPIYTNSRGRAVTSCVVRHLPASEAGTPSAERARKEEDRRTEDMEKYAAVLSHLPQPSMRAWAAAAGMAWSTLGRLVTRVGAVRGGAWIRHEVGEGGQVVMSKRGVDLLPDIDQEGE